MTPGLPAFIPETRTQASVGLRACPRWPVRGAIVPLRPLRPAAERGCFRNQGRCPEGGSSLQTPATARFFLLEAGRGLQDAGTTYRGCSPSSREAWPWKRKAPPAPRKRNCDSCSSWRRFKRKVRAHVRPWCPFQSNHSARLLKGRMEHAGPARPRFLCAPAPGAGWGGPF